MAEFFLGRKTEQSEFRKMLEALVGSPLARSFPTVLKGIEKVRGSRSKSRDPYICLFYGEGGMGKSTLSRRLERIALGDLEGTGKFRKQFLTVRLDWEKERDRETGLQLGHDSIEPETVLSVLCRVLSEETDAKCFKEFLETQKRLRKAEEKVDKALKQQNQTEQMVDKKLVEGGVRAIATFAHRQFGISDEAAKPYLDGTVGMATELSAQALKLVERSLKAEEVELFRSPWVRLGRSLGAGLAKVAARKPVVVFLDTYEIVDRQGCDLAMREVMGAAGERVLWVLTGRANLADDEWRGGGNFRGYRSDFSDETLFTKSLAQFSGDEIRQFFEAVVPGKELTEDQAQEIGRFSLGIPFVVRAIADLWRDGVKLEELLAPIEESKLGKGARQTLIRKISQRFLVHCKNEPRDLEAVYALAMVRRSEPELLAAMLQEADVGALATRVEGLRSRYSFVLESDGVRLSEKLAGFVREFLAGEKSRWQSYTGLNEQAIAWLELQLEERSRGITDSADLFGDEAIAQLRADWIHHQFWLGEETGWRSLVPWFVLGWIYDRCWVEGVLEGTEGFAADWSVRGQQWLRIFQAGLQSSSANLDAVWKLIERLEDLEQRDWFGDSFAVECRAIIKLARGNLLSQNDMVLEALRAVSEAASMTPGSSANLKCHLAQAFSSVGWKLIFMKGSTQFLLEAERAFQRAITLQPAMSFHWSGLAVAQLESDKYEQSITSCRQAIELNPKDASAYNTLGNVQSKLCKEEEAIANYEKAIRILPGFEATYINLGVAQSKLGRNEEAAISYEKAIEIDPEFAVAHNNLGNIYRELNREEDALSSYKKALTIAPGYAEAYSNMGLLLSFLGQTEEAISSHERAVLLEPQVAYRRALLGLTQFQTGRLKDAVSSFQKSIELEPDNAEHHRNLSTILFDLNESDEAFRHYNIAVTIEPDNLDYHGGLGWQHLKHNHLDLAKHHTIKALDLDANQAWLLCNLGLVLALENNLPEAIQNWQQGIELHSEILFKNFYAIAIRDQDNGIEQLQQTLNTPETTIGDIEGVLMDAEVLTRCPTPIPGIAEAISLLKTALEARQQDNEK